MPADLVKIIVHGTLALLLKVQRTPDLDTICDALRILQTETKTATETTVNTLDAIKNEVKNNTETIRGMVTNVQRNMHAGEEARAAAKEAVEVGKKNLEMARQMKNTGQQTNGTISYAAMAARGTTLAGIPNIQVPRAKSVQTQREVIINIRDPSTIQSLRAMNPRDLNAHVERAITQSGNENIANIKILSSNQLKSGDLSIKTATSSEVEALKQFAEDWVHRIGHRAVVRIPTYGVIAHSIRTSTMDTTKFEETRDQILQDNRPFIPQAEIKYIGWLTRNARTKTASSIIIEFTKPEDANKIIDEGLIWQGEVLQCERYERQCRLKQCYKCQHYGHIGTQCKAITVCGYCAQEHETRNCTVKLDRNLPRKCAVCKGEHEAWSQQCPARKEEKAKAKAAYDTRPYYHATAGAVTETTTPPRIATTVMPRNRPGQTETPTQSTQEVRNRSQSRRGQKRTSTGHTIGRTEQADLPTQRPRRNTTRSRRAIEAIEQLTQNGGQHMEIDTEEEA